VATRPSLGGPANAGEAESGEVACSSEGTYLRLRRRGGGWGLRLLADRAKDKRTGEIVALKKVRMDRERDGKTLCGLSPLIANRGGDIILTAREVAHLACRDAGDGAEGAAHPADVRASQHRAAEVRGDR
jgi:hypothetical protein